MGKSLRFLILLVLWFGLPAVLWARAPAGRPPAEAPADLEDFWNLFWFGAGWFGFAVMILLVLCSVATLALIIEDFLSVRRGVLIPDTLGDAVRERLSRGELEPAERLCQEQPSFLATVLLAGLREAKQGHAATEKAMEEATQDQNARLHRKIEYLNLCSSVGPLLGLLGTVWGMVVAFQKVAETHGRADPGQLAGGIYQALYTTVIGLLIAIPGLTCYAILRNRVDSLSSDVALLADRVMAPLMRVRVSRKHDRITRPAEAATEE